MNNDEIKKIRTHIMKDLGNTAWSQATNYAPLDVEHCGEELWSLWYNRDKLSVFSIKDDASLADWKKLQDDLEKAFNDSVNRQNN